MYMSRDQEKIKSKGVNQLQWPHCHSFRHIFPFSRTDNVTTCIAWTFPFTGKTLVKPLRLSTWLRSASHDCYTQTLLGFPHREWSKYNEMGYLGNKAKKGELYFTLYQQIFSCPYPLLQERKTSRILVWIRFKIYLIFSTLGKIFQEFFYKDRKAQAQISARKK